MRTMHLGFPSRRGLTPRGSLECNPEIPARLTGATPVHRPQRPAGSTHSSTGGLRPPEQLERPAGFPAPRSPSALTCGPHPSAAPTGHFLVVVVVLTSVCIRVILRPALLQHRVPASHLTHCHVSDSIELGKSLRICTLNRPKKEWFLLSSLHSQGVPKLNSILRIYPRKCRFQKDCSLND